MHNVLFVGPLAAQTSPFPDGSIMPDCCVAESTRDSRQTRPCGIIPMSA
jgi:hypothetical protein